jgi:hypothetical protein
MKKYLLITLFSTLVFSSCNSKIEFTIDPPKPIIYNSDLLISEISIAINTSSGTRPHYVELFNGTGISVNLADYAIGYMAVSDLNTLTPWSFPTNNFLVLSSTLPAGKCYVVASPQSDPLTVKSDITWGTTSTTSASAILPLQLSGNSAIALLKKDLSSTYSLNGVNYKIIDVFGSPLVARVQSQGATSVRNNIMWTIAGELIDTRNRTFFRKVTILKPTINWEIAKGTSTIDSEWIVSGDKAWDFTNIGLPTQ